MSSSFKSAGAENNSSFRSENFFTPQDHEVLGTSPRDSEFQDSASDVDDAGSNAEYSQHGPTPVSSIIVKDNFDENAFHQRLTGTRRNRSSPNRLGSGGESNFSVDPSEIQRSSSLPSPKITEIYQVSSAEFESPYKGYASPARLSLKDRKLTPYPMKGSDNDLEKWANEITSAENRISSHGIYDNGELGLEEGNRVAMAYEPTLVSKIAINVYAPLMLLAGLLGPDAIAFCYLCTFFLDALMPRTRRTIPILVAGLAAPALIAQIVIQIVFAVKPSDWTLPEPAFIWQLLGFVKATDVWMFFQTFAPEVFALTASLFFLFTSRGVLVSDLTHIPLLKPTSSSTFAFWWANAIAAFSVSIVSVSRPGPLATVYFLLFIFLGARCLHAAYVVDKTGHHSHARDRFLIFPLALRYPFMIYSLFLILLINVIYFPVDAFNDPDSILQSILVNAGITNDNTDWVMYVLVGSSLVLFECLNFNDACKRNQGAQILRFPLRRASLGYALPRVQIRTQIQPRSQVRNVLQSPTFQEESPPPSLPSSPSSSPSEIDLEHTSSSWHQSKDKRQGPQSSTSGPLASSTTGKDGDVDGLRVSFEDDNVVGILYYTVATIHKDIHKLPVSVRMVLDRPGRCLCSILAMLWATIYPSYLTLILLLWSFTTLIFINAPQFKYSMGILNTYCLLILGVQYIVNYPQEFVKPHEQWNIFTYQVPFTGLVGQIIATIMITWCAVYNLTYDSLVKAKYLHNKQVKETGFPEVLEPGVENGSPKGFHTAKSGDDLTMLQKWTHDAKDTMLKTTDQIILMILFTLAFVGSSADVIQAGYLGLVVFMALLPARARRVAWHFLLLYSVVAVCALFIWNINCPTPSSLSETLGLDCYREDKDASSGWGSLISSLFMLHWFFVLLVELQYIVYSYLDIEARRERGEFDGNTFLNRSRVRKPWYFLSHLKGFTFSFLRLWGIWILYILLLVMTLGYEPNAHNVSSTLVGLMRLAFFCTCFFVHMMSLVRYPWGPPLLTVLVQCLLLAETTVLCCRYLYQFDSVSEWVSSTYSSTYVTLPEVGLEVYDSMFKDMFPMILFVLFITVQLTVMMSAPTRKYRSHGEESRYKYLIYVWNTHIFFFIKQLLVYYSGWAIVLCLFIVGFSDVNVMNLLYILFGILICTGSSWKGAWWGASLLSGAMILTKYLFQFQYFASGRNVVGNGPSSAWWGYAQVDPEASALWDLMGGNIAVLLFAAIQRSSHIHEEEVENRSFAVLERVLRKKLSYVMSNYIESGAVPPISRKADDSANPVGILVEKRLFESTAGHPDKEDDLSDSDDERVLSPLASPVTPVITPSEITRYQYPAELEQEKGKTVAFKDEISARKKGNSRPNSSNGSTSRTATGPTASMTATLTGTTRAPTTDSVTVETIEPLVRPKKFPQQIREILDNLHAWLSLAAVELRLDLARFALLVSAFCHYNVYSLIYLVALIALQRYPLNGSKRSYFSLQLLVIASILLQCLPYIGFLPSLGINQESWFPWSVLSPAYEYWLAVGGDDYGTPLSLVSDVIAMMILGSMGIGRDYLKQYRDIEFKLWTSMCQLSGFNMPQPLTHDDADAKHQIESGVLINMERSEDILTGRRLSHTSQRSSRRLLPSSEPDVASVAQTFSLSPSKLAPTLEPMPGDFRDFTSETHTTLWDWTLFTLFIGFERFVYLLTFLSGTWYPNVFSLLFGGLSIHLLITTDKINYKVHKHFHWLVWLNLLNLLIVILFQAPFFPLSEEQQNRCDMEASSLSTCLTYAQVIGLKKYSVDYPDSPNYVGSIPIFAILLFLALIVQEHIYASPSYEYVHDYYIRKAASGGALQRKIVKQEFFWRATRWQEMISMKASSALRLRSIIMKTVASTTELLEVSLGMKGSLPPLAPSQPIASNPSSNTIDLEWDPPIPHQKGGPKILSYRIVRQISPSMTLMGDFDNMVEIPGNITRVTIPGLHPGKPYEFRVCAINKNGEGPLSVASEPVATQPLDFGISVTAGWMRLVKTDYDNSGRFRFKSFMSSFKKSKVLKRYVVMDGRRFTWYVDEKTAAKHRTEYRRTRFPTSFKVNDIALVQLQLRPFQFDESSPLVRRFEILVKDKEDKHSVYVVQPESEEEVDKWNRGFAIVAPHSALSRDLIELRDALIPDDEEDEADEKSETSSQSGTLEGLDLDDHEEVDKTPWWLPVYRFFWLLQDSALREETPSPVDLYSFPVTKLGRLFFNILRSYTVVLVWVSVVGTFCYSNDLLAMISIVYLFGCILFYYPRPPQNMWKFLMIYTVVIMGIKYLFQLSFFCQNVNSNFVFYPSIQPGCPSGVVTVDSVSASSIQAMVLFGVYKFDGSLNHITSTVRGVAGQFLTMIALLIHASEMRRRGLWVDKVTDDHSPSSPSSTTSSTPGVAVASDALIDEFMKMDKRQKDSIDDDYFGPVAFATPVVEAFPEQEATAPTALGADEVVEGETVAQARKNRYKVMKSAVQVYVDETKAKKSYGLPEFLSRLAPRAVNKYYDELMPSPPTDWDKDLKNALQGMKPGVSYRHQSLTWSLLIVIYVTFFSSMFNPVYKSKGGPENSEGLVSSLFPGITVLVVWIQILFLVGDEVAYLWTSLRIKIFLQYLYLLVLHIQFLVVIPLYTNIYFWTSARLVILYILAAIYLAIGAQQIKYGYRVFRGNAELLTASGFGMVAYLRHVIFMAIPFAFEMKALLSWSCARTSMTRPLFVMLEEIYSSMYINKCLMQMRLSDETLRGQRKQPTLVKFFNGGACFCILLLILLFPMLLFSNFNPAYTANEISTASISLSIRRTGSEYSIPLYQNQVAFLPRVKEFPTRLENAIAQQISSPVSASTVWQVSPPSKVDLIQLLQDQSLPFEWALEVQLVRPFPADKQRVIYTSPTPMSFDSRSELAKYINASLVAQTASPGETGVGSYISPWLNISSLYRPIVDIPTTREPAPRNLFIAHSAGVRLSVYGTIGYWSLQSYGSGVDPDAPPQPGEREIAYECGQISARIEAEGAVGICLVAVSPDVVTGLATTLGKAINGYGITAIYIFILVTIGAYVRNFFRGDYHQIIYQEIPDSTAVLDLCEGVFIARQMTYVGHLRDEMKLFELVCRVLRSPELLLRITGRNNIYIPNPQKLKVD